MYLLYLAFKSQQLKTIRTLIALLALIAVITTHITMLRTGSSFNYANPAILLLIITFSTLSWDDLPKRQGQLKYGGYAALGLYMAALFIIVEYYFDYPQRLGAAKQEYRSLLHDKDEILSVTKSDTLFFLNSKYTIVFDDESYGWRDTICIWTGLCKHWGPISYNAFKILFVSTTEYDSLFETGVVKYIIAEDDSISKPLINSYYKHYNYLSKAGKFCIYKYAGAKPPDSLFGFLGLH